MDYKKKLMKKLDDILNIKHIENEYWDNFDTYQAIRVARYEMNNWIWKNRILMLDNDTLEERIERDRLIKYCKEKSEEFEKKFFENLTAE